MDLLTGTTTEDQSVIALKVEKQPTPLEILIDVIFKTPKILNLKLHDQYQSLNLLSISLLGETLNKNQIDDLRVYFSLEGRKTLSIDEHIQNYKNIIDNNIASSREYIILDNNQTVNMYDYHYVIYRYSKNPKDEYVLDFFKANNIDPEHNLFSLYDKNHTIIEIYSCYNLFINIKKIIKTEIPKDVKLNYSIIIKDYDVVPNTKSCYVDFIKLPLFPKLDWKLNQEEFKVPVFNDSLDKMQFLCKNNSYFKLNLNTILP
jgi:hypothetical protein